MKHLIILLLIGVLVACGKTSTEAKSASHDSGTASNRMDAFELISQDEEMLESCYTNNFEYDSPKCTHPMTISRSGLYMLDQKSVITDNGYTLIVRAIGNQISDTDCETFIVQATADSNGNATRKATNSSGQDTTKECWRDYPD